MTGVSCVLLSTVFSPCLFLIRFLSAVVEWCNNDASKTIYFLVPGFTIFTFVVELGKWEMIETVIKTRKEESGIQLTLNGTNFVLNVFPIVNSRKM